MRGGRFSRSDRETPIGSFLSRPGLSLVGLAATASTVLIAVAWYTAIGRVDRAEVRLAPMAYHTPEKGDNLGLLQDCQGIPTDGLWSPFTQDLFERRVHEDPFNDEVWYSGTDTKTGDKIEKRRVEADGTIYAGITIKAPGLHGSDYVCPY